MEMDWPADQPGTMAANGRVPAVTAPRPAAMGQTGSLIAQAMHDATAGYQAPQTAGTGILYRQDSPSWKLAWGVPRHGHTHQLVSRGRNSAMNFDGPTKEAPAATGQCAYVPTLHPVVITARPQLVDVLHECFLEPLDYELRCPFLGFTHARFSRPRTEASPAIAPMLRPNTLATNALAKTWGLCQQTDTIYGDLLLYTPDRIITDEIPRPVLAVIGKGLRSHVRLHWAGRPLERPLVTGCRTYDARAYPFLRTKAGPTKCQTDVPEATHRCGAECEIALQAHRRDRDPMGLSQQQQQQQEDDGDQSCQPEYPGSATTAEAMDAYRDED
jgi:hypothetical protein